LALEKKLVHVSSCDLHQASMRVAIAYKRNTSDVDAVCLVFRKKIFLVITSCSNFHLNDQYILCSKRIVLDILFDY
jgi:hypothetical protein